MSTVIGVGLQSRAIASILKDRRGPRIEEVAMNAEPMPPEPIQVGKGRYQVYPWPPPQPKRGVGFTRAGGSSSKRQRKLQKQARKANR